MSIIDYCQISLPNPENTVQAGSFLAHSLYSFPVTILLSGELGTGKTTLLRGFANALGIAEGITSPTFALEQRYETRYGQMAHIDLYRLTTPQARELLQASEEHCNLRCIEWPERLSLPPEDIFPESIAISLREEGDGRHLSIAFRDVPLPSREEIEEWRKELNVPPQVIAHCDAVAAFIPSLLSLLSDQYRIVRPQMLCAAALTHDLLRFVDFRKDAYPDFEYSPEQERFWSQCRQKYAGLSHEYACERFLSEKGYAALGRVVATHGLSLPSPSRTTIEQKVLFYADKRVKMDTVVSLDERFADFNVRYGKSGDLEKSKIWYEEAKRLENELFPAGISS